MKTKLFFVDAESDGLYGSLISIAVIVTDYAGNELERCYWGIARDKLQIQNEWVKENVEPILGDYIECQNEQELLNRFWNVWERYYEQAYVVADVCYPVESRMFEKCIQLDIENRAMKGPFPLIDLSSLLLAKNMNPLADRTELVAMGNRKHHNALTDVEMSIEIWRKYINE